MLLPLDQPERAARADVVHPHADIAAPRHEALAPAEAAHESLALAEHGGAQPAQERPLVQRQLAVTCKATASLRRLTAPDRLTRDEPLVGPRLVVQRVERDRLHQPAHVQVQVVVPGEEAVYEHLPVVRAGGQVVPVRVHGDLVDGDGVRPQLLALDAVALVVQQVDHAPVRAEDDELKGGGGERAAARAGIAHLAVDGYAGRRGLDEDALEVVREAHVLQFGFYLLLEARVAGRAVLKRVFGGSVADITSKLSVYVHKGAMFLAKL